MKLARTRAALAAPVVLMLSWATPGLAGTDTLQGELARIEPMIGTWQIEATWSSGSPLWGQAEYRPILGGTFLEGRILVREGEEGELYQRYRSILAWDPEKQAVVSHDFVFDGGYKITVLDIEEGEGGPVLRQEWSQGPLQVRERHQFKTESSHWQVWTRRGDTEEWSQAMDAHWRRADGVAPLEAPGKTELIQELAAFQPYVGTWEMSTEWPGGGTLWGRNVYRVGLNGRFFEARTWSREEGGDPFEMYDTVFLRDPGSGEIKAVGFTSAGKVEEATTTIEGEPGQEIIESLSRPAGDPPSQVRQTVQLESPNAFRWKVWTRGRQEEDWAELMQATWHRQSAPAEPAMITVPIDAELFIASGSDVRSFTKEVVVNAPAADVWAAWATSAGWSRIYGAPSASRIDLAIGGRYEWLFDGEIGSNGCQVLSYIPDRMISFSWNAPPTQPESREKRTWVVVECEPLGEARTRVRLTHLGFGSGPAWDETRDYFLQAWDRVLSRMQSALGGERASAD